MGGGSPILPNTQAQATALEAVLNQSTMASDRQFKTYIAMRYWHPFSEAVLEAIQQDGMEEVILLPLYPQFSTTTTESSFEEWHQLAKKKGVTLPTYEIGCYPLAEGFIAAQASLITEAIQQAAQEKPDAPLRVIFSAHGLPKKIITGKGDPYVWQVEQTAAAIVKKLNLPELDWVVSYQSRVGPVEWVQPYTDATIRKAGEEGRAVVLVPLAFVSEHIETLVELDIENRHLAEESGCPAYFRVPTVSTHPAFIAALAALVQGVLQQPIQRICPPEYTACRCFSEAS
jgi:ferrochelatase